MKSYSNIIKKIEKDINEIEKQNNIKKIIDKNKKIMSMIENTENELIKIKKFINNEQYQKNIQDNIQENIQENTQENIQEDTQDNKQNNNIDNIIIDDNNIDEYMNKLEKLNEKMESMNGLECSIKYYREMKLIIEKMYEYFNNLKIEIINID